MRSVDERLYERIVADSLQFIQPFIAETQETHTEPLQQIPTQHDEKPYDLALDDPAFLNGLLDDMSNWDCKPVSKESSIECTHPRPRGLSHKRPRTTCRYPESLQNVTQAPDNNVCAKPSDSSSSDEDNCMVLPESVDANFQSVSETPKTAEYYFEQIRQNCQLAVEALQRGHYEKSKNIVVWAHDLKNKSANEVKKAAEKAWEVDKDQEIPVIPSAKPIVKKSVIGVTKRVEQFRKNLRRWMIGAHIHHIGVEWLVYARMEHLQAIASFILGDDLPSDPASSTAVAESIRSYLQLPLENDFVEQELAEPEPGKRYAIGQGLLPYLQDKQKKPVPTMAFTMPHESDPLALEKWLSHLKLLFPIKPNPKSKAQRQSQSC